MRSTLLLLILLAQATAAPPEVVVVKPIEREVFDHEDVSGRMEASSSVEIRSRLTGYLDKILFKEGAAVRKGDVLAQLDDRLQRAELDKAKAEVVRVEAGLKRAEADRARTVKLFESKVATREDLDRSDSTVDEAKATVAAVRASLEVAKLNLEFTRITTPIDGRIGRRNLDAGNLVRETDVLTTIYVLDPLYAVFELDERTVLRLMRYMRDRKDDKVSVGLALTGDEGFPRTAVVDFVGPSVDPKTGALRERAVLPNAKDEVRPGQFVRVRVQLGDPRKVMLLPAAAIGLPGKGDRYFVRVVNDKNVLEDRPVRITNEEDGAVEIVEGLKLGERVVQDPQRHKAGDEVKPLPAKDPPTKGAKPGGLGMNAGPAAPLADFPGTGPALVITANYPGADAHTVEEAVAGPIGEELADVEGQSRRILACTPDGQMRLTVLFKPDTDLNVAMVVVQNRVSLAEPRIPEAVRQAGIRVKKRSVPLCAIAVQSPDGRFDVDYLGRFLRLQIRDELVRPTGVSDGTFYGDSGVEPLLRMEVDRDKLAALGLTTAAVLEAIRGNGVTAEPRRIGTMLSLPGRTPDAELLGEIVVKVGKDGQTIPLRSVARIELASAPAATTRIDGKPAVVMLLSRTCDADAKTTAKAVQARLAELSKRFPEGVEAKVIDGEQ